MNKKMIEKKRQNTVGISLGSPNVKGINTHCLDVSFPNGNFYLRNLSI